jgi:hypothetical protein
MTLSANILCATIEKRVKHVSRLNDFFTSEDLALDISDGYVSFSDLIADSDKSASLAR